MSLNLITIIRLNQNYLDFKLIKEQINKIPISYQTTKQMLSNSVVLISINSKKHNYLNQFNKINFVLTIKLNRKMTEGTYLGTLNEIQRQINGFDSVRHSNMARFILHAVVFRVLNIALQQQSQLAIRQMNNGAALYSAKRTHPEAKENNLAPQFKNLSP